MTQVVLSTRRRLLAAEAADVVRDVWRWRHLVRAFVLYDIKSDKRNNIMGNLWHLLDPVLNMLIFMFVVQVVFGGRVPNYPVFFFSGVMFFRVWTLGFARGTSVLVQAGGLIRSCNFPRIAVVAPVPLRSLYDLCIESLVLIGLMALFGIVPGWQLVLVIPFVFITLLGSSGAVLLLSCLGVRFRDLSSLMQHINRMFFYFTPVMYPLDFIPEQYRDLYMLNPVSGAVEIARDVIVRAEVPPAFTMIYYSSFCLALFVAGLLTFARLQARVAKYL